MVRNYLHSNFQQQKKKKLLAELTLGATLHPGKPVFRCENQKYTGRQDEDGYKNMSHHKHKGGKNGF
jgi:hypothetical protein